MIDRVVAPVSKLCNKRMYFSVREARKALRAMRRKGCKRYYYCRTCHCWHLTSKRPSDYDKKAEALKNETAKI